MIFFLCALALLAVGLAAISLRKTYGLHPAAELERRARGHDRVSRTLYQAVAYGQSLTVLLWAVILLALAGSFALLGVVAPWPLVFLAEIAVVGYAFAWAPTTRVTNFGVRLALWLTPPISAVLAKAGPVLDRLARLLNRAHRPHFHTGLYERADLLALLKTQRDQPDSRMSHELIDLLCAALQFGDKLVRDCMTPRAKAHLVAAEEPIGPGLMRALHDSGQLCFVVYADNDPERLVGTLSLHELVSLKHTGTVADMIDRRLAHVHEDYPLEQVLDAFYKTHQHLFIVVNEAEEFVGVITIEDILSQLIGYRLVDDFDSYDSRPAVAAHRPARHALAGSTASTAQPPAAAAGPKKTAAKPTEVIE